MEYRINVSQITDRDRPALDQHGVRLFVALATSPIQAAEAFNGITDAIDSLFK